MNNVLLRQYIVLLRFNRSTGPLARYYPPEHGPYEGRIQDALREILLLQACWWRVEDLLLVGQKVWGGCCVLHGVCNAHTLLCLVYAALHWVCSLREGSCKALRRVGS